MAQAWPVLAQVGPVLPWHVPLVAPGGISQVSPEQQSAVTVHEPVSGWHAARQIPSLQMVEQHSAPVAQVLPFGRHELQVLLRQLPTQHFVPVGVHAASGRRQFGGGVPVAQTQPISPTYLQAAPVQQGSGDGAVPVGGAGAVEQIAPLGRHWVGGWTQRRTPSAPGVQGAPPQHWSWNWQIAPGWMQHCGSFASQPRGQVVQQPLSLQQPGGPPKQRMMPAESGLQTSCLP
jgi:hypothetical protein